LGTVLVFVGLKMVWLNQLFDGHFPIGISLGIIATVIAASVVLSLVFPKKHEKGSSVRPATDAVEESLKPFVSNQTAKREHLPTTRWRKPSRSTVRFLWRTVGFYLLLLGLGLVIAAALSE
jgi:hypothetical protein